MLFFGSAVTDFIFSQGECCLGTCIGDVLRMDSLIVLLILPLGLTGAVRFHGLIII